MRERQVVLSHVLEIFADVVAETTIYFVEIRSRHPGSHNVYIHVVGGSAHMAKARVGPHLVHLRPFTKVVFAFRHHETAANSVSR